MTADPAGLSGNRFLRTEAGRKGDFGSILDKWEKQNAEDGRDSECAARDAEVSRRRCAPGERRYRLIRKKPDASIDIHGLTRDEAWIALENFFEENSRNGNEKVLIIHGKGNHRDEVSGNEGILKETVRQFLENHTLAGESGYNPARDGGTGATWVILRQRV